MSFFPSEGHRRCLRVLIADRSPLFRQGVRNLLEQLDCYFVIAEADDFAGLCGLVSERSDSAFFGTRNVDLVLVDWCLPGLTCFDDLKALTRSRAYPVLIMTDYLNHDFLHQSYATSIQGVIHKTASLDTFVEAVISVSDGHGWWPDRESWSKPVTMVPNLSERQRQVFDRVKTGMLNKQIAVDLGISENTVKQHVSGIYRQLGMDAPNRIKLALAGAA